MKIFEIANVRNPRGNGCPVIKHVMTRVNYEKTKKRGGYFSHLSSYELGQRADLCSLLTPQLLTFPEFRA